MADTGTLHDAFIDELRDAYDGERQLTKALPKLAKAATAPALKKAFTSHLTETEEQIKRLEQVFGLLGEKPRGKHCEGIAGIIEEGAAIMKEDFDDATMDACLVAAGQRAEHYEIAAYGTLVAWARVMGHDKAAGLLQRILDEEGAADKKLSSLAESGINQRAVEAGEDELADDDEDDSDDATVPGTRTIVGARSAIAGRMAGSGARRR
jgi:ferritin-like metal-binding protein YciE